MFFVKSKSVLCKVIELQIIKMPVKLSFTQLVGESIAAISVLLEAILKLENVDYCGKRLSESAVLLI